MIDQCQGKVVQLLFGLGTAELGGKVGDQLLVDEQRCLDGERVGLFENQRRVELRQRW